MLASQDAERASRSGPYSRACWQVVRAAGRVFPLLAAALPGDGMNAVLGGVLRGAGRQTLGAAMNLLTFWVLGLPLAALLAFKAGWGIAGLWSGLATATTLEVSSRGWLGREFMLACAFLTCFAAGG